MLKTDRTLFSGMVRRHVATVAAIFTFNLLLSSAQTAPNAALLKLIAAKHSHGRHAGFIPVTSPYHSSYRHQQPPSSDDISDMWQDNPRLTTLDNSDITSGDSGRRLTGNGDSEDVMAEDGKDRSLIKRFHPSAFFGSRGKRMYGDLDEDTFYYPSKRFQQGFVGSRGKRLPSSSSSSLLSRAMDGQGEEAQDVIGEEGGVAKRFDPSGFTGSRGKRYLPGLEAYFLSQMYKKHVTRDSSYFLARLDESRINWDSRGVDAEKWKRQSLLGFHAARG